MVNTILITTVVVLVVIVLMLAVAFKQLLKEYLELYSRVLDYSVDEFIMHLQVPAVTEEYDPFAEEEYQFTTEQLRGQLIGTFLFEQWFVGEHVSHLLWAALRPGELCPCDHCDHVLWEEEKQEAMRAEDARQQELRAELEFADWHDYNASLAEEFKDEFPKTEGSCTSNMFKCECFTCQDKLMYAGLDMVD